MPEMEGEITAPKKESESGWEFRVFSARTQSTSSFPPPNKPYTKEEEEESTMFRFASAVCAQAVGIARYLTRRM